MEASNITVIIPVHTVDKDVKKSLSKAIKSTEGTNMEVLIVTPDAKTQESVKVLVDDVNVISTDSASDFCTLVNEGVKNINTEWFTILEFDDTITDLFTKYAVTYIDNKPDVSMFIPFEDIYDYNNDNIIGSANEAPWASSFSSEIGFLDFDALQSYYDFYLTGSVFNKDDWNEVGGLKTNLKLVFWYEFMLRLTNLGKKIYIIPKIMYNHYLNRENSLVQNYVDTIKEDESKFWFEAAKKEYFYTKQREVTYTPKEETLTKD